MKAWKYGDNVNTDQLFPGKYTYTCSTPEEILPHLLEDLDPEFSGKVKEGDIIFAGSNFGCGSSREQPAVGLRSVGISAVVAKGFARIFYRAAINQGLLLVECPDAVDAYKTGDAVTFDAREGVITVAGKEFSFPKLPEAILAIRDNGGLLKYTQAKLSKRTVAPVVVTVGAATVPDVQVTVTLEGAETVITHAEKNTGAPWNTEIVAGLVQQFRDHYATSLPKEASFTILDTGAAEYVICARLEAALVKLGPKYRLAARSRPFLPSLPTPPRTANLPILDDLAYSPPRSRLYVPGSSPKFVSKAPQSGADMVSFDLEDGVAPSKKEDGRILVRNALYYQIFNTAPRHCFTSVRINPLEEVIFSVAHADVVVCPKVESAADVLRIMHRLSGAVSPNRVPPRVLPLIESALGVENAYEICRICADNATGALDVERDGDRFTLKKQPRAAKAMPGPAAGVCLGFQDYTADIGAERTAEGHEVAWAASRVLNAAAACGIPSYDSVFTNFKDPEGLAASTLAGKKRGYAGKACIHPSQTKVVNEMYTPTLEAATRAQKMIETFEAAGGGATSFEGKMIDEPIVKRARRVVEQAKKAELL